jgi:hypothetical protein
VKRLFVLLGSGLVVACLISANAVARNTRTLQHVTIFGDSSAAALTWDSAARAEVEKGNRVTFELQGCGRLWTPGCFNPPPPSVLSEVRALGRRIGPNVVILVGYNDDPHVYHDGIDAVLRAMRNHGVKHVLWLTLRWQAHPDQYRATNVVIRTAAHRWPIMTVVPWAGYSGPHPEWFTDGIHFTGTGAVAFATYIHHTLQKYGLTGPIGSSSG